ncbi:hypothetical protein M433DRAFT_134897 [Acidomyces richmondensis BFW]|nr:MAG: hypothetical protein FE78DRAFT_32176 [Acidomyces sp. 'richmondensis']KYG45224.1 hypothetical protein M433DRAFT_134897 [Acidomyces richmondensis BFW]
MSIRKYTVQQLLALRDSPLVEKPAELPAIEQWIEYVYVDIDGKREKLRIPHSESSQPSQAHHHSRPSASSRQQQRGAADASPMGNFSAGQRPSVVQTRSATKMGDDVTLGPPKMTFASSRNLSKLTDLSDKPAPPLIEGVQDEQQQQENQPRSRLFGEKPGNRKSTTDTDGKHNRENWMEARQRKHQTGEEEKAEGVDRNSRFGRRDREQDGDRRNAFGDRPDVRWGPREERKQNGEKQGGWRERASQRERDWDKGGQVDKVPEWVDDLGSQDDDSGMLSQPKNQEEFEKWKRAQHARNKKSVEEQPVDPIPDEPSPLLKDAPKPKPPAMTLKLEGFGGLGDFKRTVNASDPQSTSIGTTKSKSRFMSFLGPKEVEPREAPLASENAPTPTAHDSAKDSAEDKEGFQRILQMLGGTGISRSGSVPEPTSPPPARQISNGTKPRSRFTDFFDQSAKSPERLQSPPSNAQEVLHGTGSDMLQRAPGMAADPNMFGPQLPMSRASEQPPRTHATLATTSTEPIIPMDGLPGQQRPLSGRMNDVFLDQPPSRGAATPDINIQHLLASQRNQRQQQGQGDEQSQFLLNLMRGGSSQPPSQQAPRQESNFPLWLDPPPNMPETHVPKPRAPHPPGLFEDHLHRTHHHDPQRQDSQQPHQMPVDMQLPLRRQSQRAAPSFFDEQNLFLQQHHQQQQQQQQHQHQQQQQRHHHRHFTEPPHQQPQTQQGMPLNRRMNGHPNAGLQMQIPPQQPPQFPPDAFIQSPTGQQGPPPGFNPHMPRHPPGIGGNAPNIFMPPQPQPPHQTPHLQQHSQRDAPPPGFGLLGGGLSMMTQPPQHTSSQPNPPPGFYSSSGGGPPGIPPPGFMHIRSPPGDTVATGRGYSGGTVFDGLGQSRR